MLGVFGVAGVLWRRRVVVLVVTSVLGVGLLVQEMLVRLQPANADAKTLLGAVLQPLEDPEISRFLFAFLVGACVALYASQIALDGRLAVASVVVILLVARWGGPIHVLGAAPLLYMMLWFGHRVVIPGWNRIGDPSYGVYLYGWPVQALCG